MLHCFSSVSDVAQELVYFIIKRGIYGGKLKSKSKSIEFKMVSSRFLPISIFVEERFVHELFFIHDCFVILLRLSVL